MSRPRLLRVTLSLLLLATIGRASAQVIGPQTATELGRAIALVATRADTATFLRYFEGNVKFTATPDIQWRRDYPTETKYCAHQVAVFADGYEGINAVPSAMWRWMVNVKTGWVSRAEIINSAEHPPGLLAVPAATYTAGSDRCADGSEPVPLPE